MRKAVSSQNIALISADYRLAPQVNVSDILSDVQDCIAFIRTTLTSKLPNASAIDPTRLAVSGSSAGGYLALLAGLYTTPKPSVIAPIYPITDPLGTFFTNPQPPPMKRYAPSKSEMEPYLDPSAPAIANCGTLAEDSRMHMYVYMLGAANLAQLYGTPTAEAAAKYRIARNVYEYGLPPAYFLHGDADSAVGVEQADEVVGAVVGCGGEVVYERVRGKDHFLDAGEEYRNEAFWGFVMKHL